MLIVAIYHLLQSYQNRRNRPICQHLLFPLRLVRRNSQNRPTFRSFTLQLVHQNFQNRLIFRFSTIF